MAPVLRKTLVGTRQKWLLTSIRLNVKLCNVVEYVVENDCIFDVLRPRLDLFHSSEFRLIFLTVIVTLAGVLRGLVDTLRGQNRFG